MVSQPFTISRCTSFRWTIRIRARQEWSCVRLAWIVQLQILGSISSVSTIRLWLAMRWVSHTLHYSLLSVVYSRNHLLRTSREAWRSSWIEWGSPWSILRCLWFSFASETTKKVSWHRCCCFTRSRLLSRTYSNQWMRYCFRTWTTPSDRNRIECSWSIWACGDARQIRSGLRPRSYRITDCQMELLHSSNWIGSR